MIIRNVPEFPGHPLQLFVALGDAGTALRARDHPQRRAAHRDDHEARAFPFVRDLSGFDFAAQPSLDPKQVRELASARWIANGENVLLLGPPEPAS